MRGLEESERMAKTRRQTEKEKECANGLRVNFPWWDNVVEERNFAKGSSEIYLFVHLHV